MKRDARTSLLGAVALLFMVGCGGGTEPQHDLTVKIAAASSTSTVGNDVNFSFEVTGPRLIGVVVAYGDGVVDTVDTFNATSASGILVHAFQAVGIFMVEATVVDAQDGHLADTVSVQITP